MSCSRETIQRSAVRGRSNEEETDHTDVLPELYFRCMALTQYNEPGVSSRLIKPKTEPALLPVKQEHLAMAADDETAFRWAWDDYVREEMERQCRTLEEVAARRPDHEEDGVVILDDSNENAPGPSNPVRHGDPGQGCSKNDGVAQDDNDNDGDDYTNFCKLLGM
ncbi:Cysteine-rich receptor-like protein kinase 10 [Hordeum vulgare]|nr:Cysteine-rich receptor-like protein kinase 10 [Hordeum vulgare]